jgi:hypothetical protein
MWAAILSVLVLLSGAVLTGGLIMVALAVVPTFRSIPAAEHVRMHRTLDRYIERFMPLSAVLTILGGIALANLHTEAHLRTVLIAAVALTVMVSLISHLFNRPINLRMHTWSLEALPADLVEIRERWARLHLLRTLVSVAALALYAVAAVHAGV